MRPLAKHVEIQNRSPTIKPDMTAYCRIMKLGLAEMSFPRVHISTASWLFLPSKLAIYIDRFPNTFCVYMEVEKSYRDVLVGGTFL